MEKVLEVQTKAKEISRQYGQYKVRPAPGASRGTRGQDGSQMCYFNLTVLEHDSVRVQPTTELDHKMTRLQILVDKYARSHQQNTFTMFIKGKIDSVLKVHKAQDNKTNIFIASQILGASMHAFQYIQFSEISFGGIDLNLDKFNYEGKFRRTVLSKIEGKQEDYDGCLEEIGKAIYKCNEQLRKVVERCNEEEAAVNREGLVKSRAEIEKIAGKEQTDLTTIQKKCDSDIAKIESTSENLWKELELAKTDFKEAESAILRKHKELRRKEHEFQPSGANSQSQMKEIERLRREDTSTEKPKRENILMETEKAVTKATTELREWGNEITNLKDRVAASLEISEDMQGCARKIFDKAETQRKEWHKKLTLLKYDCLKAKNDPLMAKGLIYQLMTCDCERNLKKCTQRQNKLDEKLKTEVRYGDTIEQERLKKKIQECERNAQEKKHIYESSKTELAGHVTVMKDNQRKINEIVTESHVYEPQKELREKFEKLQARMEKAFECQSTANLRLIIN